MNGIGLNTALVFSAVNGNPRTIADVDAGEAAVQVALSAANGTLTLGAITGLTFTSGDGVADASMTFTGTLAAINADLAGLRYEPAAGFSGVDSLTIMTNDLGNSGAGGPLSASDTVAITVSASATADLQLTVVATPDPVPVGNRLTYILNITNRGAFTATGVTLFDNLPPSVTFVSITQSQGTGSSVAGDTVTCQLGALVSGASATVTLVVIPTRRGTIVNRASVAANERDNDPSNNRAVTQTAVGGGLRLAPAIDPGPHGPATVSGGVKSTAPTAPLTPQVWQPIYAAALTRWQEAGMVTTGLRTVEVRITDLPGSYLGLASENLIWLDRDAAGYGWFVDPTPAEDQEFHTPAASSAVDRADLLTVLAHELGHVLGLEHTEGDDLMGEMLPLGVRRSPAASPSIEAAVAMRYDSGTSPQGWSQLVQAVLPQASAEANAVAVLSGTDLAYGLEVAASGLGSASYNLAVFRLPNTSTVTVLQQLQLAGDLTVQRTASSSKPLQYRVVLGGDSTPARLWRPSIQAGFDDINNLEEVS